jgi:hypothetical protein
VKIRMRIAVLVGALALALVPATALAVGQPEDPGSQGKGPPAGKPENAKAYGWYCREESRKHVDGEEGTPFSQCVTAMAKTATNENLTPRQACKELSRKHIKGEKGTPFSQCVVAAAQLKKDQQD